MLCVVLLLVPFARADRILGLSAKEFSSSFVEEHWQLGNGVTQGTGNVSPLQAIQLKATGATLGEVASAWSKQVYDFRELSSILTLGAEGAGGGSQFSWIFANDPADGSARGVQGQGIDLWQPEHWIGFAVAFNLRKGSEHDPAHRDVTVLLGGTASAGSLQDSANSCKVNFSFERIMLKIMVYQRTLFVFTSEHGDMNWQECAVVPLDNLAPEALSAGRMGFQSDGLPRWDPARAQTMSVVSMDTDSRWDMAGSRPLEDHRSEGAAAGVEGRGEWQHFNGHMDGQAPDINTATMSIGDAKDWCAPRSNCHGFTFNADEVDVANGQYDMHFKETTAWSTSSGWHSYIQGHLEATRHGGPVTDDIGGAEPSEGSSTEEQVAKMKLHEWSTEERIRLLEESINEKIVNRFELLEQNVEETLDSNLVSRIGDLETQVTSSAQAALTERIRVLETDYHTEVDEKLTRQIDDLELRIERHFGSTKDGVVTGIEAEAEERLTKLEEAVRSQIASKINEKVHAASAKTRTWVGQVAQKLDKRADASITNIHAQVKGEVGSGGGWKIPFFGLCVVLVVASVGFSKWHKEQKKNHLL